MKKIVIIGMALGLLICPAKAEDWVMAATKAYTVSSPAQPLELTIEQAQDYAVQNNRSLRNADLAVRQAYAQRWQTIAAMLPQVDFNTGFTSYCGYQMEMSLGGAIKQTINMPDYMSFGVQASVGINGQAVVGALLNNLAIDMQKISLEQSESDLRANVRTSYVSLLVLQNVVSLMDSSLANLEQLSQMTQRTVDLGAAEQTKADQIVVRVNALKNNINANKRSIVLAENALKVLLDIPSESQFTLTTSLDDLLSAERLLKLLSQEFVPANNLTYQTLSKNVDLAKTNVKMAGWAYGPTLGMAYQYTNQKYFDEGGFRMTPPNLVSVSLSVPLWSSGKRAAAVVDKKIALEEARNTFAETTDNLNIQNQQLRYNLQNAYETYLNEKENMEVSQRVFVSTTNKYHYGSSSNLELVNASNDVISAQSTYVQAVLNLVKAQVEFEKFLNN